MKHLFTTLFAAMMVLSAAAQNSDVTSTVVGEKLNFEAPLFGLITKNIKPMWSIVGFGDGHLGYSYQFEGPSQINASGLHGEISILELRYRPWRGADVFTCGISAYFDRHNLKKGKIFEGSLGETFIDAPDNYLEPKANTGERIISLNIGYIHEWGSLKAGIFVSPGYGNTIRKNTYKLSMPEISGPVSTGVGIQGSRRASDVDRTDQFSGDDGFRLAVKAGIWYEGVGLVLGWRFGGSVGSTANWPRRDAVILGIAVRY